MWVSSNLILGFANSSKVGDGEPMKAWPLALSLTGMVEFLPLNFAEDDKKRREAIAMSRALHQPAYWVKEEEQRRVFITVDPNWATN